MHKEGTKVGCDIHPHFETLRDGKWAPTWGRSPDPEYWWEVIADAKLESGAAELVIPMPEGATDMDKYKVVSEYFKAMPLDRAEAEYGYDRRMSWSFNLPQFGSGYQGRFKTRDYSFFGWVSKGVRTDHPDSFPRRPLPDDLSPEIRQEFEKWDSDAHSESWLMVSEMLEAPGIQQFDYQREWLTHFIAEPSITRMVFWFDN
ncbi:MAG: hypothetical protein EOP83_02180 [Verrucomicrobiaceae bacterium]|nr:MAG: hypothetical protein EOP83_02180 [Verrucomicrobiaceae bacterium]